MRGTPTISRLATACRTASRRLIGVAILGFSVTLSAAASAQAAPYNEVGLPSGAHAGHSPKGWVIVIHGGGWSGVGHRRVAEIRPQARRFERRGWGTINVDYRPGARSVSDVAAFYDTARSRYGSGTPICLFGQSAGGQIALIVSAMRPVDCVIVEGAPTDLLALPSQAAFDPGRRGAQIAYDKAVEAFGLAELAAYSPLHHAAGLTAPTLMATADNDWMIPRAQMDAMHDARPDLVSALHLAAGDTQTGRSFAHAYISRSARSRWERAKARTLASVAR